MAEIRLVEARDVIWPDARLRCIQSGVMYAQVLMPGLSVQFEALGQMYEYHTDLNETILLCDSVSEGNGPSKDSDKNIEDGWPNETKDNDVIIATPIK